MGSEQYCTFQHPYRGKLTDPLLSHKVIWVEHEDGLVSQALVMVEFLCAMNVGVLICPFCMCDARDTCLALVKRVELLMSSTNSETLYLGEGKL